jgi:hypothetical protein
VSRSIGSSIYSPRIGTNNYTMKFVYLIIALFVGLHAGEYKARNNISFASEVSMLQGQDPLANIEKRIGTAMTRSFMRRSVIPLTDLRKEVESMRSAEYERLATYWMAHTDFQTAIFYLNAKDTENCEAVIKNAIKLIESVKSKNSEEFALLAYLQGFSIQFAKGLGAAKISKTANTNAQTAVKMDPENLRGYYVLGSLNFYTPKAYGGGKKVEDYLSKAIKLPANKRNNPYLPSWGLAESYELLVRQLRKEGRPEEANGYLDIGLDMFPDHYQLNSLAAKGK